jgi:aconitase A
MSKFENKLSYNGIEYRYYGLEKAKLCGFSNIDKLPIYLKVILENLLRYENGINVHWEDLDVMNNWLHHPRIQHEITFYPSRILMSEKNAVRVLSDLTEIRNTIKKNKGDISKTNPFVPIDIIIENSHRVEDFEEYNFLKWGEESFKNINVHNFNEYISNQFISIDETLCEISPVSFMGEKFFLSSIASKSLWSLGIGAIEAESIVLGKAVKIFIPDVIGINISGKLKESVKVQDIVFSLQKLIEGTSYQSKVLEFYGTGVKELSPVFREEISNYIDCAIYFPPDHQSIQNVRNKDLTEQYLKEQGIWFENAMNNSQYSTKLDLDLSIITHKHQSNLNPTKCIKSNNDHITSININKVEPDGFCVENARILALIGDRAQADHIYDIQITKKRGPQIIMAGKDYGHGTRQEWAAKETIQKGVKIVIAESFDRRYRSNLIDMGVLPLQFQNNKGKDTLNLKGTEKISFSLKGKPNPQMLLKMKIQRENGEIEQMDLLTCIDTLEELDCFQNGGILNHTAKKCQS